MDHGRAASMIADYAVDRLGEEERRAVDEHLESCASCRELLEQARELRAVLPTAGEESLFAHVQSEHLTRYARRPSGLEPRLASWVEEHLRSCAACREAVEILRDLEPMEEAPGRTVSAQAPAEHITPWEWLTRTLLHPAPALVYLVLLIGVVGVWIGGREPPAPAPPPEIELLPPAVSLYPEEGFRSEGGREAEAVEIALDPAEDLHLRIHTEIDDRILEDEAAAFRLEISGAGETVASRRLERSELSDLGILNLRIRGDALRAGETYRLEVRLDRPAAPRHDEVLFERTVRLVSGGNLP